MTQPKISLLLPQCSACSSRNLSQRLPKSRPFSSSTVSRATNMRKLRSPLAQYADRKDRRDGISGASVRSDLFTVMGLQGEKPTSTEMDEIPLSEDERRFENTHRINIFTHKHNAHITLSSPKHEPLLSLSCGNLGFRKGNRGTFEAAYQLGALTFRRIQERGHLASIKHIELILRGFGPGRDAIMKCLLGPEGKAFRNRVVRVTDSTRVKFGGTRSPRARRLG